MKRIIGTGMLGGLAFAALSLGAHRTADACNNKPPAPPEPCAFDYDEETRELVLVESVVSVSTPPQETECGCGQTLGDLPDGADVVGAGFVGPTGTVTTEFCGTVLSEQTRTAFSNAVPGTKWSAAAFSGVSKAGIIGGQTGWAWFRIANIGADGFPGKLALGKIDIKEGTASLDSTHQLVTSLQKAACTDCSLDPTTQGCNAIAAIEADNHDDDDPSLPTAATSPARVCVNEAATELIARERGIDVDGGGCNVSRGGASAAAGFLAVLGAVFAFGRARRRRRA